MILKTRKRKGMSWWIDSLQTVGRAVLKDISLRLKLFLVNRLNARNHERLIFYLFSSCGALPFPSLNKPHMKRKRKERKCLEVILTNPVFHDPSHFFSLFNSRWQLNPFFFSYELPDDY